jgi:arylsulfatase
MHVTTMLPPKYEAMVGTKGRQGLGRQRSRHEADGRQHRSGAPKLEQMGQLDNTIVVFTTDNGAEAISFPDGGVTPFKGQKGEAWEGRLPRSSVVFGGRGTSSPGRSRTSCSRLSTGCPRLLTSPAVRRVTG